MQLLRVDSLTKTYAAGVRALDRVSLTVGPGVFGLLGPNGAGKTTLMKILATLLDADEGRVEFAGLDVLRQKRELRQQLGYLPQEFGLDPRLRCEELLDHLAVLKAIGDKAERRREVDKALERTHLAGERGRRLGTFSGGMKQRFGIAQALLGGPRLLIVDEPTAGLDPEERRHLLDVLADLGGEVVVLLSTHIVEDVAETCQELAVLHQGRVRACGSPASLVDGLAGRVWQADADGRDLPAGTALLGRRRLAGRASVRVLGDQQPAAQFHPATPDLEDAYFAALTSARES